MLSISSGCILQQIKGQWGSARTKVGPIHWNKVVTGRAVNHPSDNQLTGTTEQPSIIAWLSSLKHLYGRHKSTSCLQFILHPSKAALRACSWSCSPFNERCSRAVIPTGFPVETEMSPSVMVHCPARGAQQCEIAVHCLSLPATFIMLIRKASSCQGCCNPVVGVSLELPWLVFPTQAPKGKVMGFPPVQTLLLL